MITHHVQVISCYLDSCHLLTETGWQSGPKTLHYRQKHHLPLLIKIMIVIVLFINPIVPIQAQIMLQHRQFHSSVVINDQLLLLGGVFAPNR